MIAPLLPHELEIGGRQSEVSNQVGFDDFRRKGVQSSALRLGEDASRHLVLHAQTFHGGFPVPLGGQTVAPGGLQALVAGDLSHQHQVMATTHQVGQAGVAKRVGGHGHLCLLTQAAQREVNRADGQPATPWVSV